MKLVLIRSSLCVLSLIFLLGVEHASAQVPNPSPSFVFSLEGELLAQRAAQMTVTLQFGARLGHTDMELQQPVWVLPAGRYFINRLNCSLNYPNNAIWLPTIKLGLTGGGSHVTSTSLFTPSLSSLKNFFLNREFSQPFYIDARSGNSKMFLGLASGNGMPNLLSCEVTLTKVK